MKNKTVLNSVMPWGLMRASGSRLLCSDGKIRSVSRMSESANSFFSIPCAVKVNGKTVAGYATTTEQTWIKGEKENDFKMAYTFRPYEYRRNFKELPAWETGSTDEGARKLNAMIEACYSL